MELILDATISHQLLALPQSSALAYLLSKAQVAQHDLTLEALLCRECGLNEAPDYPMAAISAYADGLDVGSAYWLRAAPVHLLLQRDSFILSEPVPLAIAREHALSFIADLNAHFGHDQLQFFMGDSGAWYLRLDQDPQVKTYLPQQVVGKNVYQFMPHTSSKPNFNKDWASRLNEIQMLLHEHPVNIARDQAGLPVVNSIWFSGGGALPSSELSVQPPCDLILSDDIFYRGLAMQTKTSIQPCTVSFIAQMQTVAPRRARVALLPAQVVDDAYFQTLLIALKAKKIKRLTLNLALFDKALVAIVYPIDVYKFWRKVKPVAAFCYEDHH